MVRLIQSGGWLKEGDSKGFQFHYGTIDTKRQARANILSHNPFQFHYGTIDTG